jgi:deoxycytidylate deaminase
MVAPLWPQQVQRACCRRTSLDASRPQRMTATARASGAWCWHRSQFSQSHVFAHGLNKLEMDAMVERFFQAFFGRNDIAPSKAEYGMDAAKSASLRSTDLARQVGAAVLSNEGDILTQSCNEVPKAHGFILGHRAARLPRRQKRLRSERYDQKRGAARRYRADAECWLSESGFTTAWQQSRNCRELDCQRRP